MAEKWDDGFKKASDQTKAGFDADFEAATGTADSGGESEAEKNTREEAESRERAQNEKNEREKKERKESVDRLLEFYKKLISASLPDGIFGVVDVTAPVDKKLSTLKRSYAKLVMEFHEDKYNSTRTANPFPAEITAIAKNASNLLNSFYDEAIDRINRVNHTRTESNRKSNQGKASASFDADTAAARAAEEAINGEADAKKKAEEERVEKERAQEEEKVRNEQAANDQEEQGVPEEDAENATNENREDANASGAENGTENPGETGAENNDTENVGGAGEAAPEGDTREKELADALNDARNHFAKTEYNDRTRMDRIRKALNMSFEGREENPNIESARKPYEEALRQHMEYQVDKLQASGLEGKELEEKVKELYSFFNLQEATKYYDARTEAKLSYLADGKDSDGKDKGFAEKSWDFARLKSTQISEWYSKKVPTSVKLGLAAASFIPGASAFALGKRTWGAFMMVAAGGMQLDKLAQFKDAMSDKLERNKEFKNMSAEDGKVDFDKLKDLLGGKIDNIDRKLNEKNVRSGANKFIAFAGAMFLGATTVKGMMDFADGKTVASTNLFSKFFHHDAQAPVPTSVESKGLDLNPKDFVTPDGHNIPPAVGVDTPNLNAFDHPNGGPVNFVEGGKVPPVPVGFSDNLHTTSATESLRIEKGSSIEKTLIDHFRKIHPEMKNPGAAAHRMWLDYMHDNKAELVKKMGESEYAKTLKDGMVNVKAGTKLILDEHDPLKIKLHDIGGKISHLNVGEHAHAATTNLPPTPEYVVSSAKPFEKVVDGLRSDDVLKNQIHSAPPAEKVLSTDDVQRIVNEKMYRADEAEYSRLRQYLTGSQDKIKSLEAARRELLFRNQNIEGVEWDQNASEIGKLDKEISGIEHDMNDNQHRLEELKQKEHDYVKSILKADKLNHEAMEHAEKLKVAPTPEVTPSVESAPTPDAASSVELGNDVGKSFVDALKGTSPEKLNENVAKWMSGEFQKSGVGLDKVSKMGYDEAVKIDPRVKMTMMRVFEHYKNQIGVKNAAIQAGRGETIGKWMERIGRLYDMKRSGVHV